MSEIYLDDLELQAIEVVDLKEKLAKLEEKVAEKQLVIETLKQQNLEWQHKLSKRSVKDANKILSESQDKVKQKQEARKKLFKEIAKKYGLEGSWGYDPLSGLIHLSD